MSEPNKAAILQFYQAFDDRNLDQALNQLAPNFVAHLAGIDEPLDVEGFKQFGQSFYNAFTNGQHQFNQVIAIDDRVVTCGTYTATHLGMFQGLPPTGKTIQLDVMHIDRLEAGQIVEHWGQGDALGLMQQLGVLFLPGPALVPALLKQIAAQIFKPSQSGVSH